MSTQNTRRKFLKNGATIGVGCSFILSSLSALPISKIHECQKSGVSIIKKGAKQLFVDDVMLAQKSGVTRKVHAANKLPKPVLIGDKPWEVFSDDEKEYPYAAVYGTVLKNEKTDKFRMWYNVYKKTCYAESVDGVNWNKPELGQVEGTNKINLFDFHSPSIIYDKKEKDPAKRYKAIGSKDGFSKSEIDKLKAKFNLPEWYKRKFAYCAAYSADGMNWTMYPEPILLGMDTITLAQNSITGEYLAFHKQTKDPRSIGRQVFLSTSNDMLSWSETELVMATDETDHREARKLEGGTHSEFYNMSAFYYGSQWLGLVTHFRCMGEPLVDGRARGGQKGIIDVQLVHSRDGKNLNRCSDRSAIIPLGPYEYDEGMAYGVCNTPVFVGDEMWMYYTASTDIHPGHYSKKKVSIARAAWRLDGMISLWAGEATGTIETILLNPEGSHLYVNSDVAHGKLLAEVLDSNNNTIKGYEKENCKTIKKSVINQLVQWNNTNVLPQGKEVKIKFHLTNGDLYSYVIK